MLEQSKSQNDFITEIYSTVLDSGQWEDVLNHIAWLAGAKAANVCLVDYLAEELNSQFMCAECRRFYPVYINTPHMQAELKAVARLPQTQTTTEFYHTRQFIKASNRVFHEDPIDLTESEQWLDEQWGVRHRYLRRLNLQPSYLDIHTLFFDDLQEKDCESGLRKVAPIAAHLAKAVEISRPFLLLQSRFKATVEVLDRFHLGVFILSSDGCVVQHNRAADRILDLADCISVDPQGRLRSEATSNKASLQTVIDNTLNAQTNGSLRHSTEFALDRRSRATPYLLEITPLNEPTVVGPLTGLMVLVIDPDDRKIVRTEGMQQLFGLSKAETNVCQLLVEGYSTEEIAQTRNVSPLTIKNQVKSLLAKTDSRNRSELIRKALSINLPVDDIT